MKKLFLLLLLPALSFAQLVPGILRDASYAEPPDSGAGAWSYINLGSGTCTSVTDSSGTLTIEASGSDIDNGCLVYQTLDAATAQVYGRVSTITGTAAATVKTGAIIANSIASDSADCMVWWNDVADETRGVTTPADGQAEVGGITGNATAIPVHVGATFVDSTNLCELFDNATATTPAVPSTDFAGVPQPHQSYSVDASAPVIAGFYVQSGHASNTATVTITDYEVQETIDLADSAGADPDTNLIFRADFETGSFDYRTLVDVDSGTIQTMRTACEEDGPGTPVACPDPASPPRCWTTQSCGSHTHAYSDTVVTSDGAVNPRAGNYMLRYETRVDDYAVGNPPGTTNERAAMKTEKNDADVLMQYDTTYWIGVSVYKPSAEYSPNYTDTALQISIEPELSSNNHMTFLTFRPQNAGDTTPTQMRASCRYYTTGPTINTCAVSSTGMGWPNPIDDYYDEWMDIIIEFKAHATTGVYKVYTRRAEQTNTYTLQADYSGPLGWFNSNKTYTWGWQLYGGGGFPLVIYYDEIRIVDSSLGGTIEDAKPTPIADPP
jgi:hypothetical protein